MIVVDTNIWSELWRPAPEPRVVEWAAMNGRTLYVPAIVVQEIGHGIAAMPDGRRRAALEDAFAELIASLEGRVLSYDLVVAQEHTRLRQRARSQGRILPVEDGQILATAAAHRAPVATRNRSDLDGYGIPIIDPWG